jgi:hypothetical protein
VIDWTTRNGSKPSVLADRGKFESVGAKTKDHSVSNSLADLMLKNLSEVFGERDSERRMAAIKNLYSEASSAAESANLSASGKALSKQIEMLHQLEDDMQRAQAYIKRVATMLHTLTGG